MNVIGGMSLPGRIAIISDKFQSVASPINLHGQERILYSVAPLPAVRVSRVMLKLRWLPIPRVVRLFLFLFIAGDWWLRLLMIFVLIVETLRLFRPEALAPVPPLTANPALTVFFYAFYFLLIALLLRFMSAVRGWHGAEHMAIETYRQTASSKIEDIAKASPISPHCGGRYFLPFLLISLIAPFIAFDLGWPPFVVTIIMLEAALWIDALIGFHRLPIFAQATTILQRFVTTRRPTERELKTAHVALTQLLKAHGG